MTELGVLDNNGEPRKIKLLTPGYAGSPSDTVMSAQGIKGMVPFSCEVLNWPEVLKAKKIEIAGTVELSKSSTLNISQINGKPVETGRGKADGALRLVLAEDNPEINVNAAQAGEWVFTQKEILETSFSQLSGSPVSTGNGKADSGTQRVSIAQDNEPIEVTLTKPLELADKTVSVDPYKGKQVDGVTPDIKDTEITEVILGDCCITKSTIMNSHKSVGTWVNLLDEAGKVRHSVYAAPMGGGESGTFPKPLEVQGGLFAQCETKGANVRVSASGYASD